jgi:hypothetical protein
MSTASTTPAATQGLDEFSDRLSPMLVKELRQGLRARTFVILFLAIQALLGVVLLSAVGAAAPERAGQTVSSVIFFFFSMAVLIVQPLRGVGALHQEIKGNTIDLMVLTRLGAWRIVLGKWIAIVSQSALLLAAIAPYLILRYFFGRMNLFAELLLLALVFLGSAAFTAITVGLSAVSSIFIRGLVPLVAAVYLAGGVSAVCFGGGFNEVVEFCSLQEPKSGWALLATLTACAYFGWSALALGASMIAPVAENHSSTRRLITLLAVVAVGAIGYVADFPREIVVALFAMVAVPTIAIALTETLYLLPPICRPFVRRGPAGRLAGRFLYPGWPSGVLFTGLLVALACLLTLPQRPVGPSHHSFPLPPEMLIVLSGGLATLLLPALVQRVLPERFRQGFGIYLLILVILCVIGILATMVAAQTLDDSHLWALSWIPPVQLPLMEWISRSHYDVGRHTAPPTYSTLVTTSLTVTAFYFLALLLAAIRRFPLLREVEDAAKSAETP